MQELEKRRVKSVSPTKLLAWPVCSRPRFYLMTYDLKSQLIIQEGTKKDYFVLDSYHYLNTPLPPLKKVYTIRPRPTIRHHHASLIAVIVYSAPIRDLRARTAATEGFFKQPETLSDRLKLLNRNVLYICRVIVLPNYRRLGLASWLLLETLKKQTVPIVESLTPTPVNERWFNRLGFQVYYNRTPDPIRKLKKAFQKADISEKSYAVPWAVHRRINALSDDARFKLNRSLHDFLSKYRSHEHDEPGLKRTTYILSKLPYPNGYLLWFNPHIETNPVLDWINEQKSR